MGKMTIEEKRLYTRYFYNSVVEFIYFIILYLETYGKASASNINKYVKFFKTEVADLLSSFKGKAPADKLIQLLKTLDCFIICENEIRLAESIKCKEVIFEDFVISKCVDLLLKRQSNTDTVCKNVNLNPFIQISQNKLLEIIKKYSYISVYSDQTVTLHHFHGLIGFEDHFCKTVIGYFHDILYHNNFLSYEDIGNHSKSLSLCGLNNVIEILCILYCSQQFTCQDSYICLGKKSKKHPKQKPIRIEKIATIMSSKSMHIGQIVYGVYGPFLHQWTGEIGTIKKNYGIIYCVVDFTNGHQGIFSIHFSKAALKVISELDDLEKYLSVRDVVEFDAEYYKGKIPDRCWKATRVKICSNKLQNDEILTDKLNHNTELERSKCSNHKICSKFNPTFVTKSQNVMKKYEENHSVRKKLKTSDYESLSSSDSNNALEVNNSVNKNVSDYNVSSTNLGFGVSNEFALDYLFMFGNIFLLMEDKGIAIAKFRNKFYNILFMKSSIYSPNTSEHLFVKGQKILAVIPYLKSLEKLDLFCIPTLVYGLNEKETDETENMNVSPKEFAFKTVFNKQSYACNKCYSVCCPFNSLPQQLLNFDLRCQMQLTKLYDFINSQYKLPFTNDVMLLMLHNIRKDSSNDDNFDLKVFKFFTELVKCLPRYVHEMKFRKKNKRKIMNLDYNYEFNVQEKSLQEALPIKTFKKRFFSETDIPDLFTKAFGKRVNSENTMLDLHFTVKTNESKSSLTSFGSYKTISTNCSENFYSCESESNSPKKISVFVDSNHALDNIEKSPVEIKIEVPKPHPTVFYKKCNILSVKSSQYLKMEAQKKYKNMSNLKSDKYLSLQSVPSLKCSYKNHEKVVSSYCFKTANKNFTRNVLSLKARVSVISNSFIFLTTNIDGHDIMLPFPTKGMSANLLENIKLNLSCEITVMPNAILSLSHILSFHASVEKVGKDCHVNHSDRNV